MKPRNIFKSVEISKTQSEELIIHMFTLKAKVLILFDGFSTIVSMALPIIQKIPSIFKTILYITIFVFKSLEKPHIY